MEINSLFIRTGNNCNNPLFCRKYNKKAVREILFDGVEGTVKNKSEGLNKNVDITSIGYLGVILKDFAPEVVNNIRESLIEYCAPANNLKLFEAIIPENFHRIKILNTLSASEK